MKQNNGVKFSHDWKNYINFNWMFRGERGEVCSIPINVLHERFVCVQASRKQKSSLFSCFSSAHYMQETRNAM